MSAPLKTVSPTHIAHHCRIVVIFAWTYTCASIHMYVHRFVALTLPSSSRFLALRQEINPIKPMGCQQVQLFVPQIRDAKVSENWLFSLRSKSLFSIFFAFQEYKEIKCALHFRTSTLKEIVTRYKVKVQYLFTRKREYIVKRIHKCSSESSFPTFA